MTGRLSVHACSLMGGGVTIGGDVNISPDVRILTADHDPDSETFMGRHRPVVVQDRVWLATGATVLPGANVAVGAVLGAGAVASGRLEADCIYVGNPA